MLRRYNRRHSRFDQPDPYRGSYQLTTPQSLNRYAYTADDPVNSVDPSGLDYDQGNHLCFSGDCWSDGIGTITISAGLGPLELGGGSIQGTPDPEIATNTGTEPSDPGGTPKKDPNELLAKCYKAKLMGYRAAVRARSAGVSGKILDFAKLASPVSVSGGVNLVTGACQG